ncbi:MAG TPA: histidine--tRNA ligase [Candidatus Acidoferrales bacterium]|nr:histidine--tRNA ligase [Candidatus Acidoferrales bacterium]
MSEKRQFRAIKGTRDILPPDSALWNWVEQSAREVFSRYGFRDIRTPIFEETDLFARSIGAETDVVSKEMFTFAANPNSMEQDSSDQITLRPEATASVCRAYIEHGMQTLPGNVKLYYTGPMFRRERPQKGRYRQFYQIGAEVLGQSDAPGLDAEVIEMLLAFFSRVGLASTTLHINSIGDKNCRPRYVEHLRAELQKVKDRLGADSQRRIETNPLRVLDSKLPEEQPVIEGLPRIADHLCDDCRAHFAKLKDELKLRGIAYQENWRLVRGLDYYTRTTFEVTAAGLGSQNAVCGGGRYDGLVELLGGPPVKGIGFAIGTDRVILSIEESGERPKLPALDVFIAWMGAEAYPAAVAIAQRLRAAGFAAELPPEEMKFKKSLGLADKLGARYALILGGDEVASATYTLKRLSDARQQKLSEAELLEFLAAETNEEAKDETRAR